MFLFGCCLSHANWANLTQYRTARLTASSGPKINIKIDKQGLRMRRLKHNAIKIDDFRL